MSNISITNLDEKCGKYCNDCLDPCFDCYMGKCTFCTYGYMSVVDRIRKMNSKETLILYKDKCPYTKLILEKEEKEIDNMMINEGYMDSPETQCDRCNNNDICKYKDQVIEVNNKISEVVFNKELPIEIDVNCKKFVDMKTNVR